MHFLLGMSLLLTSQLFAATTFLTQIHRMESSARPSEDALVFLRNGRVVKVSPEDTELLYQVDRSRRQQSWVKVSVNSQREVSGIEKADSPLTTDPREEPLMEQSSFVEQDYTPSILPSLEEAKVVFRDHRAGREGETQCYNRAHVWAYDWRTQRNIYSSKAWIFFTAKYIRKYDFEWWFHVAPMVHVNVEGKVKERVMDLKYARGPQTTRDWTNIFMKDDALCPTVKTYSDHADYPETGSCFLQKTSMYFYQPVDVEAFEKYGTNKSAWVVAELLNAYDEAFGVYP